MAEADELITWLGFKFKPDAKKNIQDAQKSIDMIKEGVRKLGTFFLGASGAIGYFTNDVMKGAQQMSDLSKKMGISTDALQQWKYVAEASGQSFEGLIGDLEQFRKVGIDAVSLSGRLSGMSAKIALQYKDRFGISDDMFNVLRQGPEKIRQLMAEAYVIPSQSIEQTAEFNKRLSATKDRLVAMKNEIFMAVSPALVEMLGNFEKWLQKNKDWIALNMKNIIQGVTKGFENFVKIGSKVFDFFKGLLEYFGLVTEEGIDVEKVAKVITGILLMWSGGKILSGIGILLSLFKGLYGILASIEKLNIGATISSWGGALKGLIGVLGKVVAPLMVIIQSISAILDFKEKGVAGTLEDWKKNWGGTDWINPAKYAGLFYGWVGDKVGDLAYRAFNGDPLNPTIQAGAGFSGTTTNNTNSGNTIILQMPYEQATNFVRETTGGQAQMSMVPVMPGNFQ